MRALTCFGFCILSLAACATAPPTLHPAQLVIITVADTGGSPMPARGYHQPGYRLSASASSALDGLEKDYRLTRIDGWPIGLLGVYCAVMAVDEHVGVEQTLARVSADPRARIVQPMQSFSVHAGYDDPYFSLQYGANSPQLAQMHQRATGRGVHIAIVDTGVDRTHPDLRGRIQTARNFVSGDSRFDSEIHGTAVAGIIAANANNGVGIVGLAPNADLMALRACWQPTDGDVRAQCNTFTLAKALTFAMEQHADIVNLSLGGPSDPLLTVLIEVALARDIVVVAAQDTPDEFPASLPGVIAVRAASDAADGDDRSIEVAARQLLSTSPGGRYDYFSGSSMAAARATGITALSRQEAGRLSTARLLNDLDERLIELGERGNASDGSLVTHAPVTPSDRPPQTVPAKRIEGT